MRIRLKHVLVALTALVLLAMAHSPLLRAGLLVGDYGALLDPWGTESKPLAALSVEASRAMWGLPSLRDGDAVGFLLRLEHLIYLLLSGVGLGYFLRRLLLPWSGSEPSKAAGRAAALLFTVHPLVVWSVADVAARDYLLGVGLSVWAACLFLRGRQDQRFGWLSLSFCLAIGAGFSSWVSLALPLLLAVCDLTTTHRYRPLRTRLRTSATTFLLFGAAVLLEPCLRLFRYGESGLGEFWSSAKNSVSSAGAQEAINRTAEKLGLLVLPSNHHVLGAAGIVISGAAFLLAVQPALLAARSAPRLWGWLLSGLVLALLGSIAMSLNVSVNADELTNAKYLLPSVAVLAAGLGLGSTALSGPHRPYMAWVVVIAYSVLAHANARPWMGASVEVLELRRQLEAPLRAHPGMRTVVLDPPVMGSGMPSIIGEIGILMDERLSNEPIDVQTSVPPSEALALTTHGFLQLFYEPEFREWLGEEILISYPQELWPGAAVGGDDGARAYTLYHPLGATNGVKAWSKTLRSPALDLSPHEESALQVRIPERLAEGSLVPLSWRSQTSVLPSQGQLSGLWRPEGSGSVGWFDLGSSLAWRLGGRVRTMLFEQGLQGIDEASVQPSLPTAGEPSVSLEGSQVRIEGLQDPVGYGAGAWRLELLDLKRFQLLELPLSAQGPGDFLVDEIGSEVTRRQQAGHILAWVLEFSIEGNIIARQRGRF